MRQLATLLWLKWTLFRNSLRSSKAVVNRVATILAMLFALALALLLALGLGVAAYALTSPELQNIQSRAHTGERLIPSAEFIFFSILSFLFLIWATLPLSIGSSRQFDPGNLLLYPISLRKLFAVDFVSEVASLQSVFAIPAIIALGVGAGLAQGHLAAGILLALAAVVFGLALSKWISSSVGSLLRRKRARGETLLALFGVMIGIGGALFGQVAPVLLRHAEAISSLRWTPPGAIAYGLSQGLRAGNSVTLTLALLGVAGYAVVLIAITYWLSQRAVLGGEGKRRARAPTTRQDVHESYTGWELPLLSPELSAIVEKELRYLVRNAQVRMMTLMPLILIVVRVMNKRRFAHINSASSQFATEFFKYGGGLVATAGMLYVFLILSGLFCNQFAFEGSGMRTLILSPVDRKTILLGKNLAFSIVALVFSSGLLLVNELVFRDISAGALLFVALSFLIFVTLMSLIGNWFSLRFPRRMKFGKRLNVSGAAGLLLLPMIFLLAIPPLAATAAGYVAQSLLVEYVTLAVLAALFFVLYWLVIGAQGESLQRREVEMLAAINDPGNE
ncbi:MAG: type transport system permease protein [Pyrinomonadaceae bacterium]|nr:type transport system permease protein [Pyrinomonadaceae bacterium]